MSKRPSEAPRPGEIQAAHSPAPAGRDASGGLSSAPSGEAHTIEFVYTWDDGREEVRYRRIAGSPEAEKLISEVEFLQRGAKLLGQVSPYSYRLV